jgi:hypothetical protein
VLEGTWRLEGRDLAGGTPFTGTITRRWLPGRYFLVQQMQIDGEEHQGAEYIGYDHAKETLRSMFFSNEGPGPFCSFALEYIWQIEGDQLTIWHGFKDSAARFTGSIDRQRGIVSGRWQCSGGGYEAITPARRTVNPGAQRLDCGAARGLSRCSARGCVKGQTWLEGC